MHSFHKSSHKSLAQPVLASVPILPVPGMRLARTISEGSSKVTDV